MTTTATHHDHPRTPDDFDLLYDSVRDTFARTTAAGGPLFRTDVADDLFAIYLDALDPGERQVATCFTCRTFLRRYGHLVTVDDAGVQHPVMWFGEFDSEHRMGRPEARVALAAAVRRAQITGVHLTPDTVWGVPVAGGWTHITVTPDTALVHRGDRQSAHERAALVGENRGTLGRALAEFPRDLVARAVTMLDADALYRSEKVAGPARFLLALHDARTAATKGRARDNLLWRAAAVAPPGFANPRSAMVGTLLEDLASGMGQDAVARRFAAKMHPLSYQRPTAAPSAGNIAAAEKLIADRGYERSLQRRYARLDEIQTLWRPAVPQQERPTGGVFGHLTPKGATRADAPEVDGGRVTWVKFAAQVLPGARQIEVYLSGRQGFYGMTTAVHDDAPPILQWDRDEARNPFAWYVYSSGSTPSQWGMPDGWALVDAVTTKPSQWGDRPSDHHGKSALFVLSAARDQQNNELALFPETLRSELHAIRSTIEAFSKAGRLEGAEDASANGIIPAASDRIRVTTDTGRVVYLIDRWD